MCQDLMRFLNLVERLLSLLLVGNSFFRAPFLFFKPTLQHGFLRFELHSLLLLCDKSPSLLNHPTFCIELVLDFAHRGLLFLHNTLLLREPRLGLLQGGLIVFFPRFNFLRIPFEYRRKVRRGVGRAVLLGFDQTPCGSLGGNNVKHSSILLVLFLLHRLIVICLHLHGKLDPFSLSGSLPPFHVRSFDPTNLTISIERLLQVMMHHAFVDFLDRQLQGNVRFTRCHT
mmetsp:Transcript_33499/g.65848  ORF Transcript_33499/g.65848 Transcript_33499/m.65848 type:complete len:228 (+) Transcript_33499:1393-2076(+)